jgi:hypothetical protein
MVSAYSAHRSRPGVGVGYAWIRLPELAHDTLTDTVESAYGELVEPRGRGTFLVSMDAAEPSNARQVVQAVSTGGRV